MWVLFLGVSFSMDVSLCGSVCSAASEFAEEILFGLRDGMIGEA